LRFRVEGVYLSLLGELGEVGSRLILRQELLDHLHERLCIINHELWITDYGLWIIDSEL